MSDIVYCGACGERIEPSARFCSACGAAAPAPAEPAAASAPVASAPAQTATVGETPTATITAPPALPEQRQPLPAAPGAPAGRLDQLGPGASDFAGLLGRFLRSPGVMTATLTAAIGAAVQFVFGLLVAIVFSVDSSIVGGSLGFDEDGGHASVVTRGFRQMLATLLVPFDATDFGAFRPAPALFVLVPLVTIAVAMSRQASRLRHLPVRERLLWGALTGVPFALLMMIPLLMSGFMAPSFGWTVLASLAWGGLAGAAGACWAVRRDAPETLHGLIPPRAAAAAASVRALLRPLALLLAVTTLIGTSVWVAQTLRGVGDLRDDRSTIGATLEHALYAVGHGIHYAELGALTSFELPASGTSGGLAIPVTKVAKLAGVSDASELVDTDAATGTYRVFDYHRPLPAWVFLLLVVPLLALPALTALYAGFALARLRAAPTPLHGAAWGALVGPVWALTMVLLSTLLASNPWFGGQLFGAPQGESVLATFLLGGAALGALGGLLATTAALSGSFETREATTDA